MNVRPAQSSDLEPLFHLMDTLQAHLERSNPSIWRYTEEHRQQRRQDITDTLTNQDHTLVLAETTDEIVGFAHGIVHHRTTHTPSIVGTIAGLYVAEPHRRRGIGRRLVGSLCRFFANAAVQDVSLRYVIGNSEAEGFWSTIGFKPILVTANTPKTGHRPCRGLNGSKGQPPIRASPRWEVASTSRVPTGSRPA